MGAAIVVVGVDGCRKNYEFDCTFFFLLGQTFSSSDFRLERSIKPQLQSLDTRHYASCNQPPANKWWFYMMGLVV